MYYLQRDEDFIGFNLIEWEKGILSVLDAAQAVVAKKFQSHRVRKGDFKKNKVSQKPLPSYLMVRFNLIEWEKGILRWVYIVTAVLTVAAKFQSHRVRKGDFKYGKAICIDTVAILVSISSSEKRGF